MACGVRNFGGHGRFSPALEKHEIGCSFPEPKIILPTGHLGSENNVMGRILKKTNTIFLCVCKDRWPLPTVESKICSVAVFVSVPGESKD